MCLSVACEQHLPASARISYTLRYLQGKGTLQDDGEALLTGFVSFFAQQPSVKVSIVGWR